jgi:hypothetical protein
MQLDELRESKELTGFPLAARHITEPRNTTNPRDRSAEAAALPKELRISGTELLVGFLTALGAIGCLIWVLMKCWLFAA